jgi:ribosomal protein S27E
MTATVAGDALRSKFVDIQKKLGNYPHAAIDLSGLKKQKSRQLKIECLDCGAVWRMSRKWLAQVTACPVCQSGNIKSV